MNSEKLDKVEIDVRDNKIKEGLLLKQSRHLKQWKQRWMVLTKTHLYSFTTKGQYKTPTQVINLKDIQTTKSYYKDQYKKPFTFRIQSPQVNLHMSAKNSDQKWAWMTAIQKMIQKVIHPQITNDTYNLIRQTIKMSTAVRQTLQKKQQKQRKQSTDFTDRLLSKLRLSIDSQVSQHHINPQLMVKNKKLQQDQQNNTNINGKNKAQQQNQKVKIEQKIIQKRIQVPVQRVVQKIVKVPEIKQKIVQKIVYKSMPKNGYGPSLTQVLKQLVATPNQNPRAIVDFVVYMLTSKVQQYQPQVLQFCLDAQSRRFFAQVFLLMMNQQTNELIINSYLKFLLVLYQHCNQYFYSSDLKALVAILIREMQMNRSEFNQYLIMSLLKQLAQKDWWNGLNYRRSQIKNFVKELGSISGPQNQILSQQLLSKL